VFRSYNIAGKHDDASLTIIEAALATSAATSFFNPVKIGPYGQEYVDGALTHNNPINKAWEEAQNILEVGGDLRDRLKCIVSIGTGDPGTNPLPDTLGMKDALVTLVTETERTVEGFAQLHRDMLSDKRYFRFNVEKGLQSVGLAEYKKIAEIASATEDYMNSAKQSEATINCARNLKEKNCTYIAEDVS
jgi:predicted acylesterase/phospholipase RssA